MSILRVNPTRMELSKLKKKLAVATRGHKLLKDKRDELMRQFLQMMNGCKELRKNVEQEIMTSYTQFGIARSLMSPEALSCAVILPKQEIRVEMEKRNVMSVDIPSLKIVRKVINEGDLISYGFLFTSAALDDAVIRVSNIFPKMILLAEKEKACELLAIEIEGSRRRVNALEHVMIPDLKDTIRYITMKLDEMERSNVTRLIRIKDIIVEEWVKSKGVMEDY